MVLNGGGVFMMDLQRVEKLLETKTIGRPLIFLAVTASTMDDVRQHAAAGAAEGLTVVADDQQSGRGRFGRAWVAPAGVNLSLSILLRPNRSQIKRLSIVAALAVADAVVQCHGLPVRCKWPNDLQVGGRKLCGILIEGGFSGDQPSHAIAGIGLNVNLDVEAYPDIAAVATSVAREVGQHVPREPLLAALLGAFERRYATAETDHLLSDWRSRLDTLGRTVTVQFQGRSESGVAEDVDQDGALLLRRDDGSLVALPAGEVTLRSA